MLTILVRAPVSRLEAASAISAIDVLISTHFGVGTLGTGSPVRQSRQSSFKLPPPGVHSLHARSATISRGFAAEFRIRMNGIPPHDDISYFPFAAPARRDKALHNLLGFLNGIGMDRVVNLAENRELEFWLNEYEHLANRDSAFSGLVRRIHLAMSDGKLTPDEIEDIKHWCQRMDSSSDYYAPLTHRIQELHGILHGVAADTRINEAELSELQNWLDDAGDYRRYWPIGEVETAIVTAMRDGEIDAREHQYLLRFFSSFANVSSAVRAAVPLLTEKEFRLEGVCATDPEIEFEGRSFCFTGASEKYARDELVALAHGRGGLEAINVRQDLDYLVVCDGGNACWAFAAYGRKVEKVMQYRKQGYPIVVVREIDFLDAAKN